MSDAALPERRAAALEDSAPSNPMKPAGSKTGRGGRADVGSTEPAAGMESPDASKTWGGRRADMESCSPAKPMQAAAGMETSDARKTWGGRRTDVDASGSAKPMQTADASKAGRDRRADVGNSGAVKVMKIAAAKAAVESAAGKPGGDGRGASVEIGRDADASADTRRQRAGMNRVRLGMRNDNRVAMTSPTRRDNNRADGAGPAKTAVPLIAARIVARAVPAVVVPAIAGVLHRLHGR